MAERKTKVVSVRLKPSEHRQMEQIAAKQFLEVPAWIRKVLLEAIHREGKGTLKS